MADTPSVVVVGGGIAGLAAAWELTGGADADPNAPRVTLLEASDRLGGPLRSEDVDGRVVDVGPDGFLGRRPEAEALCREVGLGDTLRPIGASGASIYARGRLRPLPGDLLLGVPTRWWPVARSAVLGPAGSLRLLRDAVAPRNDRRGPLGDRALGPLVARRLGQRVVDVLVDPLVGGIHAGSVADMSTAAVLPQLLAVPRRGSLMRALRRAGRAAARNAADPPPPAFWSLEGGMATLVSTLERRLFERGVRIMTGVRADHLADGPGSGWTVGSTSGPLPADAVVLAIGAPTAGDLLAPHDPELATLERSVEYGSVAVITFVYPEDRVSLPAGTGFLVPRATRSPVASGADRDLLMTAGTFLDTKWPHLKRAGTVLIRASVGRHGDRRAEQLDDQELADRVAAELGAVLAIGVPPTGTTVTRWPDAFPQYRVGHLLRVSGIEAAVRRLPGVAVAGAAYRGVGIPACIASGREAAGALRRALGPGPPRP